MNNVSLVGRLTRDPELKYTPAGVAVTTFTLAVDRDYKTNGEDQADFVNIVVWRQLAETVANYLRKGRLAGVVGGITTRNYENNEGRRVYVTEVRADKVRFLEPQSRSSDSGGNNSRSNDNEDNRDPFSGDGKPINIDDDDLPF